MLSNTDSYDHMLIVLNEMKDVIFTNKIIKGFDNEVNFP